MRLVRIALVLAAALLIAACSSGDGASPVPASPAPASPSAAASAPRIEVTLTDALTMEPASMAVPVGVPVTFVVTNAGAIDHEFYRPFGARHRHQESAKKLTRSAPGHSCGAAG